MAVASWRLICRRTASQSFGLQLNEGADCSGAQRSVVVTVVVPQSPAYVAGLASGDEILAADGKWHECNMAFPPRAAMDSAAIARLLKDENARCISLYVRARSMSNALAWHLEQRLTLVAHNRRGIPANADERDAWLYAMIGTWDAEHRIQEVRRSSPSFLLASPTGRKRAETERSSLSAVTHQRGADQAHAAQGFSTSPQTRRDTSAPPRACRRDVLQSRRYVAKQSKQAATASLTSSSDGDARPDNVALAVVEWPRQLKRRHRPNCEMRDRVVVAAQRIRKGEELYV